MLIIPLKDWDEVRKNPDLLVEMPTSGVTPQLLQEMLDFGLIRNYRLFTKKDYVVLSVGDIIVVPDFQYSDMANDAIFYVIVNSKDINAYTRRKLYHPRIICWYKKTIQEYKELIHRSTNG